MIIQGVPGFFFILLIQGVPGFLQLNSTACHKEFLQFEPRGCPARRLYRYNFFMGLKPSVFYIEVCPCPKKLWLTYMYVQGVKQFFFTKIIPEMIIANFLITI